MTQRIEISIDRNECIASGQCSFYAEKTFANDEEGIAIVLSVDQDPIEKIRDAAENCPVSAISLREVEKP